MKNIIIGFVLSAILATACHKYQGNPAIPGAQASIAGKWKINSVTSYFYDAAGLRDSDSQVYPVGPDNYNFRFNTDDTWEETLLSQGTMLTEASGTYTITSDSSFTLIYPGASPSRVIEPCKILSLTDNLFVFSKQLPTVFNGVDPGYIEYVFRLSK